MEDIFTIKSITNTNFETEVLTLKLDGIHLGKISLKMTSDGNLKQTLIYTEEIAQNYGMSEPKTVTEFACKKP
jgi:hypothetical protein